jgi:hypothetical protein
MAVSLDGENLYTSVLKWADSMYSLIMPTSAKNCSSSCSAELDPRKNGSTVVSLFHYSNYMQCFLQLQYFH